MLASVMLVALLIDLIRRMVYGMPMLSIATWPVCGKVVPMQTRTSVMNSFSSALVLLCVYP
jgi:hypothetical protein